MQAELPVPRDKAGWMRKQEDAPRKDGHQYSQSGNYLILMTRIVQPCPFEGCEGSLGYHNEHERISGTAERGAEEGSCLWSDYLSRTLTWGAPDFTRECTLTHSADSTCTRFRGYSALTARPVPFCPVMVPVRMASACDGVLGDKGR